MHTIMTQSEAASTARNRDYLLGRLRTFTAQHGLPMDRTSAMLFATAAGNKASTKLTYLSGLIARLEPLSALQRYRRGLRRIAAKEELQQAPPMTREQLRNVLTHCTHETAMALLMAWKTASRMSDLEQMHGQQLKLASARSIIIDWAADTKASQLDPFQSHLLTEIREAATHDALPIAALVEFCQARQGTPQLLFSPATIAELHGHLQRQGLQGHSIKVGAITELLNLVTAGKVPLHLVPLVAKHHQANPPLPNTTIRYIRDRVALARALGTGQATQYL